MKDLTLYHYWRSSCSWRLRWALNLKRIPHKAVHVDLLKDEHKKEAYLKVNPRGFVPALQVGNQSLGESLAIIEWLEEAHPSPALLPSNPFSRARVRQLAYNIAMGVQPIQNLEVLRAHSPDKEVQGRWGKDWIIKGLKTQEAMLRTFAGTYSFGSTVTLADLCLIPQCYNALTRYQVDLGEFPIVARIYEACLKTEACDNAAPDKFELR